MLRRLPRVLGCSRLGPGPLLLEAPCIITARRGFAKKAPAKAPAAKQQLQKQADMSIVHGLNILKDGEEVMVKPDSEYPEWVFELHKPLPSLEELSDKYKADPESLTHRETKRLIREWNRQRIREGNDEKRK